MFDRYTLEMVAAERIADAHRHARERRLARMVRARRRTAPAPLSAWGPAPVVRPARAGPGVEAETVAVPTAAVR